MKSKLVSVILFLMASGVFLSARESSYLFVYFTGNNVADESIHFALSDDGYNYKALNFDQPVIDSRLISETGGVRDPHILRSQDGRSFYMVATDMVSANGWDSNRGMVLLKSEDLVHWTHSVINIQKRFSGQEDLKRVWAPQTIYDRKAGKYMIYWSMKYGNNGVDIIYYAYANKDFTDLETEPKPLFLPKDGLPCIDGDIVYYKGAYHLFYKTEGHGNGIKLATTRKLTSGRWKEYPDYKQQTDSAVEGAGTFKLIGQDKYILMYDVYKDGKYNFCETTDLKNFKAIDNRISMDFKPRHGTVIAITEAERQRLLGQWEQPKAAWLLGYAPENASGLRLAYSYDRKTWTPVGRDFDFLTSDFGPWGLGKKIYSPVLFYNESEGLWYCIWDATRGKTVKAVAKSADLKNWKPQEYSNPEDFKFPIDLRHLRMVKTDLGTGCCTLVDIDTIRDLESFVAEEEEEDRLYNERLLNDPERYPGLKLQNVSIKVSGSSKPVSDHLIGIFFEDINYGADGGLYAEMIQNRDFEYSAEDSRSWEPTTAWDMGGDGEFNILSDRPIHENNPHYLSVVSSGKTFISNAGYESMHLDKGALYDFSFRATSEVKSRIEVRLLDAGGRTVASKYLYVNGKDWNKYSCTLKSAAEVDGARLEVLFSKGKFNVDMVSLFPRETFRGRSNGLRKDLAQTLADIKPKFVRFPGGCVAHGNGIDNIYDWKGSVGPLEARKPLGNIWGYHQSRGLGYYEYFCFCEDIGAKPLPVLAAGVPCQNSSHPSHYSVDDLTRFGQQNGIPMEDMDEYIQDILDLIEWANGPADSHWGSVRAEAGHPEPFNLEYLGIGNEDLISPVFEERFKMIYDAVKAKYPEIEVVGTVGPFFEGSDYDEGWDFARKLNIDIVDEHYYVSPGWMINHQDYYDNYDRNGTKVYLGEYAAHISSRKSTIETGLTEALYMLSVERNSDVVEMTSYAPLLAREGHTQWNPDMIYFNDTEIMPTICYEIQKLFGNHAGNRYFASDVTFDNPDAEVSKRFGVSVIKDDDSGKTFIKVANLLPVPVKAEIDIMALGLGEVTVSSKCISGNPEDTESDVVNGPVFKVSERLDSELSAYSFTVYTLE